MAQSGYAPKSFHRTPDPISIKKGIYPGMFFLKNSGCSHRTSVPKDWYIFIGFPEIFHRGAGNNTGP
jgi:hypothetical protein